MPLSIAAYAKLSWYPFSDEPVINSSWYMNRLGDPSILLPGESPDKKWHLFGHTFLGIVHFISENGISWEPRKMIELRGHSPSLYMEDGMYYLIYEKHDAIPSQIDSIFARRKRKDRVSHSRIEMRSSADLILFSEPKIILDSREIPFAADGLGRPRVSRPQLFKDGGVYTLFFGASHIVLEDSRHKSSRYFASATSSDLLGPYRLANHGRPLIEPDGDDPNRSLAVGSVRVLKASDGYVALQCGKYWDRELKKSSTSLIQLESVDGVNWLPSTRPRILSPPSEGWASRYIISCDARYKEDEGCVYCYFSASSKRGFRPVKEEIGLLLGNDPVLRKVFL